MTFVVFYPFAAAVCYVLLRRDKNKRIWSNVMVCAGLVELIAAICLLPGEPSTKEAGLFTFTCGNYARILSIVTAFGWTVAALFSKEYMKDDINIARYDFFSLLTLGAASGVFLAGDLMTLFCFFEIMSFTSFMWVAHRQTRAALYASGTYLGISVAGGMSILMGLFIIYAGEGGNWIYAAAVCMIAGFGAKAGAFPVHAWLPNAYMEAPAPATALLSAVLSKTGIWGIWLLSQNDAYCYPGEFVLVIGVITMVYGGLRGVFSSSLKVTLAYSSMSQIGFILTGLGIMGIVNVPEKEDLYNMAVSGTFLHMINHSVIKLVLFLAAGIIFMNVGSYELNRVRGFGRKKPFLFVTFFLAAAGVGGIPLLNGYYSKTLLHESIALCGAYTGNQFIKASEYLFLFSGGLTAAYMIKLFMIVFVEKNEDNALQSEYESKKKYASVPTKSAVLLCALPIPLIGISAIFSDENIFSLSNLSSALISIIIGIIVYIAAVRLMMYNKKSMRYVDIFPKWMDMEKYVYRAVFFKAVPFVLGIISRVLDSFADMLVIILRKTLYREKALPYELPEGNRITHRIGHSMENIRRIYYTVTKKDYEPKYYEHELALKNTDFFESLRIIERSLSFGLLMFCIGLLLTMAYLLIKN